VSTKIIAIVDPAASRTEARTSHGQPVLMDADPPHGEDAAASPTETLLAALAGCTAMDVASILRKKRQSVTSYEITVTGEQAAEHPRVFTAISVEHRLTGPIEPEAVRRSVELSATRYCPVNAMLSAIARIEHRYHLTAEGGITHEALVAVIGPDRRLRAD
jgi:putative redox protein